MRSVAPKGKFDEFYVRNLQLPICGRHLSLHYIYVSDGARFHHETGGQSSSAQPRSQGLFLERRETLVAAGHVPPGIWVVTKYSLKGGRLRLLLAILSLQESVTCCHQNKHFFHVAPVCCITVMSQCNTVQTPKKKIINI